MDESVAPLSQEYVTPPEAVSVTLCPSEMVVSEETVMEVGQQLYCATKTSSSPTGVSTSEPMRNGLISKSPPMYAFPEVPAHTPTLSSPPLARAVAHITLPFASSLTRYIGSVAVAGGFSVVVAKVMEALSNDPAIKPFPDASALTENPLSTPLPAPLFAHSTFPPASYLTIKTS